MDHEPDSEAREALHVIGRDVVLCGGAVGEEARTPTERLGLSSFDEVAVVEYVHGRLDLVAASGPCIEDAVMREAKVGRGAVTEAVTSAELVVSRDLRHERRWDAAGSGSGGRATGVRRLVAAPVRVPGEPAVGAIVVAGRSPGIVTADEVAAVGGLAEHSSLVLTARVVRCREARAARSLDHMRLVGMAVGVVMATDGLSEGDALARLRARSEGTGHRLFETATAVLAERQMSFD